MADPETVKLNRKGAAMNESDRAGGELGRPHCRKWGVDLVPLDPFVATAEPPGG